MTTVNLQDNLNWLLIRASIMAKQRLIKLADQYDLTMMQVLTLCSLEPESPVPMATVAEFLTCDPSNVTGIVERLQQGAYIERRESSQDRRVKTIQLTPSGVDLREKLLAGLADHDAPHLENLTDAEIAILKQLIRKTIPAPKQR